MAKKENIVELRFIAILVLATSLFFLPFFAKPSYLAIKDNDLGRTYIPIFDFMQQAFKENLALPLWRPDQLMGEPFVSNPVFTPFYPLNIIFLVLPVYLAANFYLFLHMTLAAIFTFFLARSFSISKYSSFASAFFYTFSLTFLTRISAGHITMIGAFAYFPLALLAVRRIFLERKFVWAIVLSLSASFMLALYVTTFYYAAIFLLLYSAYYVVLNNTKSLKKADKFNVFALFLLSAVLLFCFSAIFLLPQLEFGPLSTRSQLSLDDIALPVWNLKRLILSIIHPYPIFKDLDHESLIYLGFVPILLSSVTLFHFSRTRKIIFICLAVLTLIFVAGTSTPIFKYAYDFFPFLKYSRVTTRLLFVVALLAALMSGWALDKLRRKWLITLSILLFLSESLFLGLSKINSMPDLDFSNVDLYEYLASDHEISRIYCTTYCFNPQLLSKYGISTLTGESPIQSTQLISFLKLAGNYTQNSFAVIFPPYQSWQVDDPPQPNAQVLGLANVKYVSSTYPLLDDQFELIKKFDSIHLYRNGQSGQRAVFSDTFEPATIATYGPNNITITYPKSTIDRSIVFRDLYYPGWVSYSDNKKSSVSSYEGVSRKVLAAAGSSEVEIKFEPKSYLVGRAITLSSFLFLLIYFWFNRKNRKYG